MNDLRDNKTGFEMVPNQWRNYRSISCFDAVGWATERASSL